jgi:hypothetical protein
VALALTTTRPYGTVAITTTTKEIEMATRTGIDKLEVSGTWDVEYGETEAEVKRGIMEYFLERAEVALWVKDLSAVVGGVAEYVAVADLEDFPALTALSEQDELELGFSDLS